MRNMYFALMEKYSSYKRTLLEAEGISLRAQWKTLGESLCRACDIPRIGYRLNLADEKRIGKAKVANSVTTYSKAFEHLGMLIPCKENLFLLRKTVKG